MPKTILVTGGAGYLGSELVYQLLRLGYRVRVLDALRFGSTSLVLACKEQRFELVRGDLRDSAAVRKSLESVDAVVHLAAVVGDPACARDPEDAQTTNIDGTALLMEHAARAKVPAFILASTCSNYGLTNGAGALADENTELSPLSLYARTKVRCEEMLLEWRRNTGTSAAAVRLATLYGVSPRMRFDLTVNDFAMQMHTTRHLVVHAAETWRPYIHVADAARGICSLIAAGENTRNAIYNLGSSCQNFTKADIVRTVSEQIPDATVEYVSHSQDRRNYKVSFARFQNEFGFTPSKRIPGAVSDIVSALTTGVITDPLSPIYRN